MCIVLSLSGIAMLESFCEDGIHLEMNTENPNHQVGMEITVILDIFVKVLLLWF